MAVEFLVRGATVFNEPGVFVPANSRMILDVAYVASSGGEAAKAVETFTRLHPLVPGAQAVVYDTALRGVHHQQLMRDLGLMTVNRVAAAAGSRQQGGGKGRKRIEKSTFVETKSVRTPSGPRDVKLFAQGGQIGLADLTETGELVFTPLQRIRTHRTESKSGTFRWYNDHRLPGDHGSGVVTVRLHANDEDRKRKFNRTENVRPIAPAIPTSHACTAAALMRSRSTGISTTRSGCVGPTAWVTCGRR
jgi:hypothetical protein